MSGGGVAPEHWPARTPLAATVGITLHSETEDERPCNSNRVEKTQFTIMQRFTKIEHCVVDMSTTSAHTCTYVYCSLYELLTWLGPVSIESMF